MKRRTKEEMVGMTLMLRDVLRKYGPLPLSRIRAITGWGKEDARRVIIYASFRIPIYEELRKDVVWKVVYGVNEEFVNV